MALRWILQQKQNKDEQSQSDKVFQIFRSSAAAALLHAYSMSASQRNSCQIEKIVLAQYQMLLVRWWGIDS